MTSKELNEYIQEKIDGLTLAVECEQAVVDRLESSRLRFHTGDGSPDTRRRVRQLVDSGHEILRLQKELDAWREIRVALGSDDTPKPTRGERAIPWELR